VGGAICGEKRYINERETETAEEEDGMNFLNLPKDKAQKKVWKRCTVCRRSFKIHRAAKACPDCLAKRGERCELESFSREDDDAQ
jgi:rubrerythrin